MKFRILGSQVVIETGDPVAAEAGVLVVPANNFLWMGGAVATAVRDVAGEAVETEASAKGPGTLGQAIATSAGAMAVDQLLHAVIVGQDLQADPGTVAEATRACLEHVARAKPGHRRVVFPPLGLDPGGLDVAVVARAMVGAIIEALMGGVTVDEVRLWLPDAKAQAEFVGAAGTHFTRSR